MSDAMAEAHRALVDGPSGPILVAPPPEQDLPEIQWLWRRVYTYGLTVILAALFGVIIWRTKDAATLKLFGEILAGLIALQSLLYLAGATCTDITRLVKAVELHRIWAPGQKADA